MIFGLGTRELIIIAIIIVLLFGAKLIPGLAKGISGSAKSFKDGLSGDNNDKK